MGLLETIPADLKCIGAPLTITGPHLGTQSHTLASAVNLKSRDMYTYFIFNSFVLHPTHWQQLIIHVPFNLPHTWIAVMWWWYLLHLWVVMFCFISVTVPGFLVVFGWSAGLSVQLSWLLGLEWGAAVGDASTNGPILVTEGEVGCRVIGTGGWIVPVSVVCREADVSFGVFRVNPSTGLMVEGVCLLLVVICLLVVEETVGWWLGEEWLKVFDRFFWCGSVGTTAGFLTATVLTGGSLPDISKSAEAFVIEVAIRWEKWEKEGTVSFWFTSVMVLQSEKCYHMFSKHVQLLDSQFFLCSSSSLWRSSSAL